MTGPSPIGVLAHRGASAAWPEHTRAAYRQALADGADGLECDVRLTADGVPVLWHDATLDRTSDGHGPLHERTLAELQRLDLMRGRAAEGLGEGPQLMTLADLVALAAGAGRPVHLAVELKHPQPAGHGVEDAVLRLLAEHGWVAATGSIGDVGVSFMSFSPGSLEHLATSVPAEHLMVLTSDPGPLASRAARAAHAAGRRLVDTGAVGGVGPGVAFARRHRAQVATWRDAGRRVRVWTVNAERDVDLCLALGVHEVTTDDPARVLRHLSALGRSS